MNKPETEQKYVIDTCSLTYLRRVYPIEVFPSVWEKIKDLVSRGALISCEDVFEELQVQDDELTLWAKEHSKIFKPLAVKIQKQVKRILSTHSNLVDLKKKKSSADPFIVATAMVYDCTVVSEEKPSGGPHKSKIPDVCKFYGVRCITLLDMLIEQGLRL
jgi:hypothetical protein